MTDIGSAVEQFLATFDTGTRRAYAGDFKVLNTWLAARDVRQLERVSDRLLIEFVDEQWRGPLERRSVDRRISAIRSLFGYFYDNGALPSNPAETLFHSPWSDTPPLYMTEREVTDLVEAPMVALRALQGHRQGEEFWSSARDRAFLCLLAYCGVLPVEAQGLQLNDVMGDMRLIEVRNPKGTTRLLEMNERLTAALSAYVEVRERAPRCPRGVPSRLHDLFISQRGTPLTTRSMTRILAKWGGPGLSSRLLRGTYAARLIRRGVSGQELASLLGFEHATSTWRYRYSLRTV